MKRSDYTDYDQLPLFLNAEMTAKLLGISLSSAYELMHEEGFPALRIGNRIVVPKEKFCPLGRPADGRCPMKRTLPWQTPARNYYPAESPLPAIVPRRNRCVLLSHVLREPHHLPVLPQLPHHRRGRGHEPQHRCEICPSAGGKGLIRTEHQSSRREKMAAGEIRLLLLHTIPPEQAVEQFIRQQLAAEAAAERRLHKMLLAKTGRGEPAFAP